MHAVPAAFTDVTATPAHQGRRAYPLQGLPGASSSGDQLGRVEQVDALEGLLLGVREGLDPQLPLGVQAGLDRVGEVASMEVGVPAGGKLSLLPDQRVDAGLGFQ